MLANGTVANMIGPLRVREIFLGKKAGAFTIFTNPSTNYGEI